MIYCVGPKDEVPEGALVINTTSRSDNWSKGLSPFFLGPIEEYGLKAENFENFWQFGGKVFACHDNNGKPSEDWFKWRDNGLKNKYAVRYPFGKGVSCKYFWMDGKPYDYVEARKKFYFPIYAKYMRKTKAYSILEDLASIHDDIYLWDFDVYNHKKLDLSMENVLSNPNKKAGHGFALCFMLDGLL
jgi:hypothetical protein